MSIPEIPGISFFFNHSSKLISDRQLDSLVGCCLTTIPAIEFVFPSSSNLFDPMLPICGKVKVMICPVYDGSVIIS